MGTLCACAHMHAHTTPSSCTVQGQYKVSGSKTENSVSPDAHLNTGYKVFPFFLRNRSQQRVQPLSSVLILFLCNFGQKA